MLYLKQSTASQNVLIGPFVDSTDGVTAETGLTIANTDIRLSKNGANIAAKNSGGGTHDENGWYQITLDATDTNTVGRLQLHCVMSGALPVWHEYWVLEEDIYEALFASGAAAFNSSDQVAVGSIAASAITATSIASNAITAAKIAASAIGASQIATDAITAAKIAADAIGASELATDAVNEIRDAVWAATTRVLTANTNLNDPTAAAIADAVWDEAIAGHVGAGSFGEEVQAHALSSEITALNDLSAAEVNAEVDTALADIHLDHLLATDYDPASKPGTATALLNEIVENDAGVSRFTVNALENAPSGSGASAETIADAVWDELQSGHVTAGSFGEIATEIASILDDTGTSGVQVADKTGYSLSGTINTLDDMMLDVGTAQSGSTLWIQLRAGASATDDYYNGAWIFIISGTGAGQASLITDYTGSTTTANVQQWKTAPDNTSVYAIFPNYRVDLGQWLGGNVLSQSSGRILVDAQAISGDTTAANNLESAYDGTGYKDVDNFYVIRSATAQAGAAGTITLDASASATDDFYNNTYIQIISGTGAGQARFISDYVGSTKVASVNANWVTNPSSDSVFVIWPFGTIPGASAPTASEVADAVWDEDATGHQTSGTFGAAIGDGDAGAGMTEAGGTGDHLTAVPWNAAWDAEVQSEVTDGLNAYDPPTKAELDSGLAALNDPTAEAIADAVLDEPLAGHVTAGTLGKAVADIETDATAILADTNELQTDDVPTLIAALPTATENRAEMDSNSTQLAAIVADTNELQTDWANGGRLDLILDAILTDTGTTLDGKIDTIDGIVDAILVDTDTTIPGLIAALNDLSAAEVNAEVLDVLNTDTFAEPTGVPAATVTLATKIGFLYMALRNQITITSTKKQFYDDAGNVEWEKDLSDDGTTYTETEGNAP